jgi:hypothetical protein
MCSFVFMYIFMAEFSCLYYISFTPSTVLTKKERGLNKLHNAVFLQ